MLYKKMICSKLDRISRILNELQNEEIDLLTDIQKNQNIINVKLDKLQEYNEIDDMNNAILFQKLQNIQYKM